MPFETPKFEKPLEPREIKETEKSKKEQWEQLEKEVEITEDAQGEKVDERIKESVVAFQAMGFPTSGSCEGHLDKRVPTPWVEVSDPNEPEEQFVGEKEIYQKIAEKYNVLIEEVKSGKHHKAWTEALKESSKNEETPEYEEWREKNKELQEKAEELLEEFYKIKEPMIDEYHLVVSKLGPGGVFRVHSKGEGCIENEPFSKGDLVECQKEMKVFTQFLKDKYFHPEWSQKERKKEMFKRDDREHAVEWFKERLEKSDKYSERLLVDSNNRLNQRERADGRAVFLPPAIGADTVEDLYVILHQIQKENPDLSFSFKVDPKERKWIEYTVKKEGKEKG